MTEEYREALRSRIEKLNYTNYIGRKRIALMLLTVAGAFLCGYLLSFLLLGREKALSEIFTAHFCGMFKEKDISDCIRSVIYFCSDDVFSILSIFFWGYSMLSGILGKLAMIIFSAKFGLTTALFWNFLIADPQISGGETGLTLFILCKSAIALAIIFAVITGEDFSYKFCEAYVKRYGFFASDQSAEYCKSMLSTAGFTVIINTLYLIFQNIQGHVPL